MVLVKFEDCKMPGRSNYSFHTTSLDQLILSTPFETQTNWAVITGAPSCGKTTLLDLLADKGYKTIPESARQYMEGELAKGRTIQEVHANAAALQALFFKIQFEVERELPADELFFLDGAVPGSLAWFRLFGRNPNEILPECFHHRYAAVFILDRLPLKQNGFRFEELGLIDFLDDWITRDYTVLGYDVVRVPVLPPQERVTFLLQRLNEKGQ